MNDTAILPAPYSAVLPTTRCQRAVRDAGFTLVEIMVVIVILGLLATLVVPNVIGMSDEAKVTKAQTDVKSIYESAKLFRVKNGKVPTMEDLTTPDDKGQAYVENIGNDPWDHEYVIRETERGKFEVISMGPDGSDGTEDDISSNSEKK
jgi:general secretion pathway protein G